MTGREAGDSYLRALVARRDAKRMIDIGFDAATEEARAVIEAEQAARETNFFFNGAEVLTLTPEAIDAVALKEAADSIEIYERDPAHSPDGRTAAEAYAAALKRVRSRYRGGKCSLCKGPALPCARRHTRGGSCA